MNRLFNATVLAAVITVATVSTAFAGNPPVPVVTPASTTAQVAVNSTVTPIAQVAAWVHLTDSVMDGTDTGFALSVSNRTNHTVYFGRLTVEWSFDGIVDNSFYGLVHGLLKPGNGGTIPFVDRNKFWLQVGTLRPGQNFSVTGRIGVPNRDDAGFTSALDNRTAKNATFFCLRVHFVAMVPGQSKPGLERRSAANCGQYTVN